MYLQCHGYLDKPLNNLCLFKYFSFFRLCFQLCIQITSLTEVHYDIEKS